MRADISVELITHTPDPERLIERSGREAYGSAESTDIDGTRAWIGKRLRGWEHDVLEHASATFRVVCSRVVSHELVRHRLASYTQRSMRFSESAINDFIIPPEVKEEDWKEWEEEYANSLTRYLVWKERGYVRQTARYVIPNMAATSIMVTMNFRELRHLITMRAGSPAQPEMRVVAEGVWHICQTNWPGVFGDLEDELKKRGWL